MKRSVALCEDSPLAAMVGPPEPWIEDARGPALSESAIDGSAAPTRTRGIYAIVAW